MKLLRNHANFVDEVAFLESRLFPGRIDDVNPKRMKNVGRYSWLYRPSHHIQTGLLTKQDIAMLTEPGKRLLSIGAHPAYLEQLLCVLGVPAENIFVADKDPAIALAEGLMERTIFDATGIWPDIGTFDLIIFPESLCMIVSCDNQEKKISNGDRSLSDAREAETLAIVLRSALQHLRPEGEIRANGPMSHPNVVKKAAEILRKKGHEPVINYERFFLRISAVASSSLS